MKFYKILIIVISVIFMSCNKSKTKDNCLNSKNLPVSFKENYLHNKIFNINCEYFKNGKLKEIKEILTNTDYKDTILLNQYVAFDSIGNIDTNHSHYISIKTKSDTITYGTPFEMNIKIIGSYYNSYIAVIIGNFNENFTLADSSSIKSFHNDKPVLTYKTTSYKPGENIIRGIVKDYISYFVDNDTNKIIFESSSIYFTKTFYVNP